MATDIAKLLQRKQKKVLEYWMNNQLMNEGLRQDLMSNDELRNLSNEFLESLLKALTDKNLKETNSDDLEDVREILAGISISRAQQGYSPAETGIYLFSLKDAIISILQAEVKDDYALLFDAMYNINRLMDSLAIISFETFIKGREEVILRQTDEISEISTPVIRVWDGILALPIIGTLDSARTQVVMESLLQQIVDSGSTIAILDISGVAAVDSLVAQHLIKTVAATRLMGAECIISGIRPEIAQTIVHLGIDLTGIITKATLASALKQAYAMLNLTVRKLEKDKTPQLKVMDRIPILRMGNLLLVTIQIDLYDRLATNLESDLVQMVSKTQAKGVLIDISALSIVDSFMGRILGNIGSMSKILDAETVVVGMQPAVAITLIELGLELKGVHTALNVEKGMELLRIKIGPDEETDSDEDSPE
ncbi:STAS domain-containing protein [Chitinophaga sp. MD30]|uniref:STAS domain-containing protein n=2 Tax=Chitinophaga TaxID=79328 RepID=UPI000BB0719E|nr:STAS domain-containing protein [Chitinophaga sp. MD30]ASZ11925.1 hypothetical protein CK934_13630 [Chitinophaga sp. MD30]